MLKKTIFFTVGYFIFLSAMIYGLLRIPFFSGGDDQPLLGFTFFFCLVTVLSILPFGVYGAWLVRERRLEGQVWMGGKQASAQVLEVVPGHPWGNGDMVDVELRLLVQPFDNPPFEGLVDIPVAFSILPHPGQVISVKYGAIFKKRILLVKPLEEQLAPPGGEASLAAEREFSPISSLPGSERLAKIGILRRIGALSRSEFQEAKRKILG